jgi:hypothetical protein
MYMKRVSTRWKIISVIFAHFKFQISNFKFSAYQAVLIFLLAGITTACDPNSSTASITDVKLTRRLNEKKEPVDPSNSFLSTDRAIHCVVYLSKASEGTKVMAKWLAVRAEGLKENEEVGQSSNETKDASGVVGFSFSPAGAQLPPGKYKVDIYLDSKDSKQSVPAGSVDFTIESGATEIIRATLATDSDGKGTVTNPATGIKKLFCHTILRGAKEGSKISANWIAEDAAGVKKGMTLHQSAVTVDEGQTSADLICEIVSGFPAGIYRVDLFIGDSARPARSISFTVGQ